MNMRKLLVGLSIAGLLAAQDGGDKPFIVTTTNVQAPVTVLDRNGDPVTNLNVLDFQLFDNGKLQNITEDLAGHPLSLPVVVVRKPEFSRREDLFRRFRRSHRSVFDLLLGENGEVAVLAFDHRIQTMTGFTSDPDKVHDAFKKLKPGSWTSKLERRHHGSR